MFTYTAFLNINEIGFGSKEDYFLMFFFVSFLLYLLFFRVSVGVQFLHNQKTHRDVQNRDEFAQLTIIDWYFENV